MTHQKNDTQNPRVAQRGCGKAKFSPGGWKLHRGGWCAEKQEQEQKDGKRTGEKTRRIEGKAGKEARRVHSEQYACPRRGNTVAAQAVSSRRQAERGSGVGST